MQGPVHNSGPEENIWLVGGSSATLDLDFGAIVSVDGLAIWNKDSVFGVRDFQLLASSDPSFANAEILYAGTLGIQPDNANSTVPTTSERIDFQETSARYFQINAFNNHGASFVGLSELAFAVVPEPQGMAMLAIGVFLIGFMARHNRRA